MKNVLLIIVIIALFLGACSVNGQYNAQGEKVSSPEYQWMTAGFFNPDSVAYFVTVRQDNPRGYILFDELIPPQTLRVVRLRGGRIHVEMKKNKIKFSSSVLIWKDDQPSVIYGKKLELKIEIPQLWKEISQSRGGGYRY